MKRKKKTDLQVVQDTKDVTDALIDRVLAELREEDGIQEEIEEQVRQHKRSRRIRITVISDCDPDSLFSGHSFTDIYGGQNYYCV